QLKQIGRLVARLHNVGARADFSARPMLSLDRLGTWSVESLRASDFIPASVKPAWEAIAEQMLDTIDDIFCSVGELSLLRLHGDCHPGNLLWNRDVPHLVDFDDAQTGPAVQDLWMFLSGDSDYMADRLENLLDGYQQFRDFEPVELRLIEPLRALRMIHYTAWIAHRWDDGAFPQAFPWFNTTTYWDKHVLDLKEQASALLEPPLEMPQ
ncbi:MAG: serine/threonine protein kinase, partial [Pseudomonadota bacterium]